MATSDPPYKFVYPPEWSDRERMHYLLAPFPPNKTLAVNDTKITFWSTLINSSSQELQRPFFTERELQARFKWNQVTSPSCLPSVISAMERAGEVTKMSDIRHSVQRESTGWVLWGMGMIGKPVSWALKNYLSPSTDEEYIVIATVRVSTEHVASPNQTLYDYREHISEAIKHTPDPYKAFIKLL